MKIACFCIICNKLIGTFPPSLVGHHKTCSKACRSIKISQQTKGTNNPNYKQGKTIENRCIDCNKLICADGTRCNACRGKQPNPFKNKTHSLHSKTLIGIASSKKFTPEFKERVYRSKCRGNRKNVLNGYILIKDYNHPNKHLDNYILEHILVMSNYLKRPLLKGEVVHHINFLKQDNRIENLYLYPNTSEHIKCSRSLFKLVDQLLYKKAIIFEKGIYKCAI